MTSLLYNVTAIYGVKMARKHLVSLFFLVIICMPTEGLKCYTCTYTAGDVDQRCINNPGSVETGSAITNCDKEYCVIKRVEFKDPPGKIQSFYRNCENKPAHINDIVSDEFFVTYYAACRKDKCNGGSGKELGGDGTFGGHGGYGVLRVPGISGAHHISATLLSFLGVLLAVFYYNN